MTTEVYPGEEHQDEWMTLPPPPIPGQTDPIYSELSRQETQEENEMANDTSTANIPVVVVLGTVPTGKVVKPGWANETHVLSDRALNNLSALGIQVIDEPGNYVF